MNPKSVSLRIKTLLFLAGFLLVFILEASLLFWLNNRHIAVEITRRLTDQVRLAQVQNHQFFLNQYNDKASHPEILAQLKAEEDLINLIQTGGRIPETEDFIGSLPRLPRITWDRLSGSWNSYKANLTGYLGPQIDSTAVKITTDSTSTDSVSTDSTQTLVPVVQPTDPLKVAFAPGPQLEADHLVVLTWLRRLQTDLATLSGNRKSQLVWMLRGCILLNLIVLGIGFWYFKNLILTPLSQIREKLTQNQPLVSGFGTEIDEVTHAINQKLKVLNDATLFVKEIGKGNLDYTYIESLDPEYKSGSVELTDSLINMQSQLKSISDTEKARKWASEGLARFVEILRDDQNNLTVLGDKVISALTHYTGSNQGGLYLLNEEDQSNPKLELLSMFAFNSKKFEQQTIRLGEGILGQAFLERATTLLTEIPESYIRITSGLGDAPPNSILIVPLKVDKEVYGLVELASFRVYQPHEIEFVEKLGENIAATLASARTTSRNRVLIEQFQAQNEEMSAQEEEMRQNMEELQATQEEMARKERDYIHKIETLTNQLEHAGNKEEIVRLQQEWARKEAELEARLKELSQRPDDWVLAEEMEKTFRTQLELLKYSKD